MTLPYEKSFIIHAGTTIGRPCKSGLSRRARLP